MNLKAGFVLQKGKYIIDSILGQGGFGITYRAINNQFNQIVVLKTLNESLRQHQDFATFQRQFMAEAHLLANFRHPNIVNVWDFFEEEQLVFMVMDYIPGENLAELIYSGHNLHVNQAANYIHQIASALSVIHKNGFLHRDIQPKNIIRRAGTNAVVLTDFGITCDFTPGIRQTHANLFSLGYSPPEQCNPQQKLGPVTDIYALTATLYYLIIGKAPTPAALRLSQAVPQTLKLLTKELKYFQPNLTPDIKNTILMGLEIDPEKRPQTVESWLALLLNKSNILELKKQNSYLTEKPSKFKNDEQLVKLKLESSILQKRGNHFANKAKIQAVNIKNIKSNNFEFVSPKYTEYKLNWINQLCLQLTFLLLFFFTAGTFGWIGFDMTLRYNYSYRKANKNTASLTLSNLLANLKQQENYTFRNHDPSSPLFDSPSIKTYSINPPKLNKLPKQYFGQDSSFPNSFSVYNDNKSLSEKVDYSTDMKTEVSPDNYSSNEEVNLLDKSYIPSDYKLKYPESNYQKYQQQNQYPDDYY